MASRQASIFALLIINKAGGLIYQKNYSEGLNSNLSQNDYLILAGTFHGIHAIAARISPTGQSSGIEVIEAESFKMVCMQSPTGVKFVLVVSPSNTTADNALKAVYEAYAEQLRDPFYAAEMPIRNENFDKKVAAIIKALS